MASVDLQHLSKSFGKTTVLQDISIPIADGEFVVLLGPSGCGKSTLLRIIAGLESQTQGAVFMDGKVIDHLSPRDRDIAMVFQQYALYPHLTVRENLAFGLKMRHTPHDIIDSRIQEAAELLDIQSLLDRQPKELSGGQRQRVAMGRAIVRKPKLFLFDEPLSNVDARLRASLRVELRHLHRRLRTTMIYVTHDQVEAMTLGEKVVILNQGTIQQIGSPEAIYHKPGSPFVAAFIGNPPMNLLNGRLTRQRHTCDFRAGDLILDLPRFACPQGSIPAVLGIRPEDIHLAPLSQPALTLAGQMDCVENLGADLFIYLNVLEHQFIIRTPSRDLATLGNHLTMYLPYNRLHLFINDRRVEREAPHDPDTAI